MKAVDSSLKQNCSSTSELKWF